MPQRAPRHRYRPAPPKDNSRHNRETQFYATQWWKRLAAEVLARDHHECQVKMFGCTRTAVICDHIQPRPKNTPSITSANSASNLRGVCRACHNRLRLPSIFACCETIVRWRKRISGTPQPQRLSATPGRGGLIWPLCRRHRAQVSVQTARISAREHVLGLEHFQGTQRFSIDSERSSIPRNDFLPALSGIFGDNPFEGRRGDGGLPVDAPRREPANHHPLAGRAVDYVGSR